MARRRLEVEIVGDATKLDRAFKSANRSARSFGRDVSRSAGRGKGGLIGGALFGSVGKAGAIGAGVAVGSAAALKGLQSVIAAAKDAQVAQANLAQAFAATGTSTAKYETQVNKAIQSTSKLAAIDDELVSESYASLLRTTGSVAKATRGVALAADIARARKISLAAATKVVEKAENGQLRGLRALGVQIDKNTTSTEAIERAQKQFAGSAVAYGRTAAGAQQKLAVAFENLQERIGTKLLPVVTELTLKLVDFIDWSEKNWPKFSKSVQNAYVKAKPFIDATVGEIRGIANAVQGMVRIVHGIFTGDWAEAWKGFKQYAIDGIGGVLKAMATLPLRLAKSLGKAAFSGLERAFTAALNRIIGLINSAIKAYNKIPLAPNIPTVPSVGGGGPSPGSKSSAAPPARGERFTQGAQTVNLVVDGRVLAQTVVPEIQKAQKRTAGQSRGRNAG